MITIDLAFDEETAKELADYFVDLGMDVKLKESRVNLNTNELDEKILSAFLEKTNRSEHIIQKINTNSYLISIIANVEDLGLGTCEICGLVATKDKLYSHRWTHGA